MNVLYRRERDAANASFVPVECIANRKTADEVAREVSVQAAGRYMPSSGNAAEAVGLTPIGAESSYALAVGVHTDLPAVVIKIVNVNIDRCYKFLDAVFRGELCGPHMPHVLSITPAGTDKAVVLMERLLDLTDVPHNRKGHGYYNMCTWEIRARDADMADRVEELRDAFNNPNNHVPTKEYEDVRCLSYWADRNNFGGDLHNGNIMRRANGQLVIIDPI